MKEQSNFWIIELGSYHERIEGCQLLLKQNHFPAGKSRQIITTKLTIMGFSLLNNSPRGNEGKGFSLLAKQKLKTTLQSG